MVPEKKLRGRIKCEGRFHELREDIAEAIGILRGEDPLYRFIRVNDLNDVLSLVARDIPLSDIVDPYYSNARDFLRDDPRRIFGNETESLENLTDQGLSILPLISPDTPDTQTLDISGVLHFLYARHFGVSDTIAEKLGLFHGDIKYTTEGVERLDGELGIKTGNIMLPCRETSNKPRLNNLSGYKLSAGFGIGPNKLRTMVFDAPYHIELHVLDPKAPRAAERTLDSGVLGIGFWLNSGSEMLVAQMQSMRGGKLPEGVEHGVAGLCIAEAVAKALGLSSIVTYSAKNHPQFVMHPDSVRQMEGIFRRDFDHCAKELGYTPIPMKDSTNNATYTGFRKKL